MDSTSIPQSSPVAVTPTPLSPPPVQTDVRPPLLGDAIRRPAWLWFTHVVPAMLLLFSGAYTYWIIGSEMDADQKLATLAQAIVLASVAALSATLAIGKQRSAALLSNIDCCGLLLMSIATMAIGVTFTFDTIPLSLPEWIAGREELVCRFFCLGMPGAFYALLILSSAGPRRHGGLEFAKAAVAVALCGGVVWTIAWGMASISRYYYSEWLGMALFIFVVAVGGSVLTAAITRLTLISYTGVRRMKPYLQQFLMFVIAVAGPVGGLYLNRTIPFPTDFQAPVIYLLAVINGGVLMLPVVRSIFWHRAIWLAQCVMFPFSAYFFIVFLPWMPLSPFALIAIGSGFLMLTPIVLGIAHGYRVYDGYREEIRDGVRWKPALACVAAVLFLPGAIGWNMWQDRRTLDQALDYVYAPDYRKDITFPGNLSRLDNALQHLRDMKHGVFLPFISPAYNAVVFHGLVLPDAKIEYLQHVFFGPEKVKPDASLMLRSNSQWADDDWNGGTVPPTADVMVKDVQVTTRQEKGFSVSRLSIEMQNPSSASNHEFIAKIRVPEGVYVSDFGLVMNNQLVPARIVEKKTALWVFEKIVNVRRDPGLLIYNNRTELEMRVFPFNGYETRRAEIELIHPDASSIPISIGDHSVLLPQRILAPLALTVTSCATPSGSVAIAEGPQLAERGIQRKPYLHVLIDCSLGWGYSREDLVQGLQQARAAFPDAALASVTAVNFEARDIVADPVSLDQIDAAAIQKQLLPFRGGFLEDRFLKRGLLQSYDRIQKGPDQALIRPQFVVITSHSDTALHEDGMADFLRLVPDARVIYTVAPGAANVAANLEQDLVTHDKVNVTVPEPVLLWQWDGHRAATLAGTRALATFPGGLTGQPLLYDPATKDFTAPATSVGIPADSRFADGVRTWAAQDDASLNPSLLQNGAAALIGLSKQTHVLVPDSSFIAVESMAQWRAMEEKEKQKLANKQVFEIEEPTATPEPSTWLLLGVGLVFLWLRNRRARIL